MEINDQGDLRVILFNVGQGDHLLIELPNGKYGLIDFYYQDNIALGMPPALSYLNKKHPQGDIVLEFVCLSHPDYDHFKGIDVLIAWAKKHEVEIENIWLYAGWDVKDLIRSFEEAYDLSSSCRHERAFEINERLQALEDYIPHWRAQHERGEQYLCGINILLVRDTFEVFSIAPLSHRIRAFSKTAFVKFCRVILEEKDDLHMDKNLLSSVLLMFFNGEDKESDYLFRYKLLFTGDAGLEVLNESMAEYNHVFGTSCEANFVKAPHHGSKYSSSDKLWKQLLHPDIAYVGISAGRRYGHPHRETVQQIRGAIPGAEVFSTNICKPCFDHLLPKIPIDYKGHIEDWDHIYDTTQPWKIEQEFSMKYSPQPEEIPTNGQKDQYLAAYIFNFDASKRDITVSLGVASREALGYGDTCIYPTPNECDPCFPNC